LAQTDGKWFYTATNYDAYSRPQSVRHYWKPSGAEAPGTQPYVWQDFGYVYNYDARSYLLSITDSLGRRWWEAESTAGYDHLDRPVQVRKGNGYWTKRTYRDTDGVLTGIQTGATIGATDVQNMSFSFDGLGNLASRADTGVSETYTYDNLNRLEKRNGGVIAAYQANGNVNSKTAVDGGNVAITGYDANRPHAISTYTFNSQNFTLTYDGNGNLASRTDGTNVWSMKWAGFDKPRWLAKNGVGSEFHYNAARSRVMQLEFDQVTGTAPNQVPSRYVRKRTYALGSTLELNYVAATPSGSPAWNLDTVRIYVPGPDGIIGAREFRPASGGSEKALVYHYDHLGSITAITDWGTTSGYSLASGNKTGRYSEDAWGQRRNPLTWSGVPTAGTDDGGFDSLTPRGFTGHEMLDDLGLVHMNGRIYDPLLGRFLSADVMVQSPGDLQAYNRYSYVKNNPLTLIDPSGFSWVDDMKKALEDALKAATNLFVSDSTKSQFNGGNGSTSGEDKLAKAQLGQGVEKGIKGIEVAAEGTTTLVKSTPILGNVVTAGQLATGKNILDPTGRTNASRSEAAAELGIQAVAGAVVEKGAKLASPYVGKFASKVLGALEKNAVKSSPESSQIVSVGENGVLKAGQFANRVFDSRAGQPGIKVSGPLGRSMTPGTGVPTTAAEAIERRGLNLFSANNAERAAIYQAKSDIPTIERAAIGGTDPEILIDPKYFDQLELVRSFDLPTGK
jgi:RHS repeat-associated protein